MWYYYLCPYGPGHMSVVDGFFRYPKSRGEKPSKEDVRSYLVLEAGMKEMDDPILYFWEVPKPPKSYIDHKILGVEFAIENHKITLDILKNSKTAKDCPQKTGKDEEIISLLKDKMTESVVEKLHANNILVRYEEVRSWFRGSSHPCGKNRKTIIKCIKTAAKYPKYVRPNI